MPSGGVAPGTRLHNDRYEIIRRIAKGGQGYVYEAKDYEKNCMVALKQTLFSDDEDKEIQAQFAQEAELLKRLDHHALPKLRDYFIEGTDHYFVMDLILGPDLGAVLKKLSEIEYVFPPSFSLAIAVQLLQVVDYLHSQSPVVIHRDIKPVNIKITREDRVFLLDLGLAKDMGKGTIVRGYSEHYSPPEQQRYGSTDVRGDLYSLGATLYHLVTGSAPPDASKQRLEALDRHEQDPLRPILELNLSVPQYFADVIHRAMAINPQDRPGSAKEMLSLLKQNSVEEMDESTLLRVPALAPTVIDQAGINLTEPTPEVKSWDCLERFFSLLKLGRFCR